MSVIKIRGRTDLIFRPYALAKRIKQRKFGDDNVSPPIKKASPSDLCDLGDEWSGAYGQIVSIELNDKPQPARIAEEAKELTPEQKVLRKKALDETRAWLKEQGIIRDKKEPEKIVLNRSALNDYRAKFGREYDVPENATVIEDVTEATTGG